MKYRNMITAILIVALIFAFATANATVYNWGEGDLFRALKAVFGTTSDGHNHDGTNSRLLGTTASNPTFATNVVAAGHKAGVTTSVSTASGIDSAALAYGVIQFSAGTTKTIDIDAGVPGQMITLKAADAGVNVTINPSLYAIPNTAHTGWATIQIASPGTGYLGMDKYITLLWLDDTTGWVIASNNGCTVTY
jgi:hypothetical protein